MVTKFTYYLKSKDVVARTADYSFTAIENLNDRLKGIDNDSVISSIANTTLKGEAERALIELEDIWFKVQTSIQDMDATRRVLEDELTNGDKFGNPLNPQDQLVVKAKIAELKEGTITVTKDFYDHYTRKTYKVNEVIQTPYTIALEKRRDLEKSNPYVAGFRGVGNAPKRPTTTLTAAKEKTIRKELVRQQIGVQIGDDKDLIADMSNALTAMIKKVAGGTLTTTEEASITKYTAKQVVISDILTANYKK